MKRKIFSKLLMGALLVASVSSFTSCKDYDDDINSLKESVAKAALQSNLDALTTQVNGIKTTADQALSTANAAATKAELSAAKSEAMTEAAKGIANAATAQEAADAAKTLAQEAKTAAESIDLSPYAKTTDVEAMRDAAITTIQSALEDYWKAEKIEAALAALKQEVADANEEQMNEMKAKVDNAVAGVNAIWNAISNISLVSSFNNNVDDAVIPLNFVTGLVQKDYEFGKKELAVKNGTAFTSTPTATYKKNEDINYTTGVVVRVSPTSADLSAANIKLINSQNANLLDKYVEVASIAPFTGNITRAESATGLWVVNFKLKAGVKKGDIEAARMLPDWSGQYRYAIAANNTSSAESRYAVTEFDLAIDATKYAPANTLAKAHVWSDIDGESWSTLYDLDPAGTATTTLKNRYINNSDKNVSPSGSTTLPYDDNRSTMHVLNATVGGKIYVDLRGILAGPTYPNNYSQVDKFFITLDDDNAGESDASEYNAWHSYTITGLNTLYNVADGPAEISVTKMNKEQDEIGFRIFAINKDGSWVRENGAAFYVYVNSAQNVATVKGDFIATKQNNFVAGVYPVNGTLSDNGTFLGTKTVDLDNVVITPGTTPVMHKITYTFYQDAAATRPSTKWSNAKYVKIVIPDNSTGKEANMLKWYDNATGKFTVNANDATASVPVVLNKINFELTKKLPTELPASFGWIRPTELVNGVYTCFPAPLATENSASWLGNVTTTGGYKSLTGVFKGLSAGEAKDAQGNILDQNYEFTFKKAGLKGTTVKDVVVTKDNSTNDAGNAGATYTGTAGKYQFNIRKAIIGNDTEYDTEVKYTYKNVSTATDYNGVPEPDIEISGTGFKTKFEDALNPTYMLWTWKKDIALDADGVTTETAMNEITYNNSKTVYEIDPYYLFGTNNSTWMSTFSSDETAPTKPAAGSPANHNTIVNSYGASTPLANYIAAASTYSVEGTDLFKSVTWATSSTTKSGYAFKFTVRDDIVGNEPSAKIEATLVLTTYDAFGKKNIYKAPIVINPHH
jgi:hypothetical protein